MSSGVPVRPTGIARGEVGGHRLVGIGHQPERERVAGDTGAGDLERERAGEGDPASLARAVGRHADVHAAGACARRDRDHPPPTAFAHAVDDRLGAVQHAVEVHPDRALPRLRIHLAELLRPHAEGTAVAGVVHEDVDGPPDRVDAREHRREVGDVERHRDPADLVGDRGGPFRDDVVDGDERALCGEHAGDAGTHVLTGTGDERDAPGEIEHRRDRRATPPTAAASVKATGRRRRRAGPRRGPPAPAARRRGGTAWS